MEINILFSRHAPTFVLAFLKAIPSTNSPRVTPPINPFRVRVACSTPPKRSTTKTKANDNTPKPSDIHLAYKAPLSGLILMFIPLISKSSQVTAERELRAEATVLLRRNLY